jgi:predicted transcriptional regulator of viral defense system
MATSLTRPRRPRWDRLYETAAAQEGHFTTAQAAAAGYSPPLLAKYLRNGRIARDRRGVYRLVHFPPGDHEDLIVLWLWSGREGVVSHETALALHGLSDVLPAEAHLTVPASWRSRRLRVPAGAVLHHDDVPEAERAWIGALPVTSASRTVNDCAADRLAPDLVRQAIEEGLERGLFSEDMIEPAHEVLRRFEGEEG